MPGPGTIDVRAVRRHFLFPGRGRIALNNAASTQPPRELLALFASLGPEYENVHRGQSSASAAMTARFEESYHTIAPFIGATMTGTGTGWTSKHAAAVQGLATPSGSTARARQQ